MRRTALSPGLFSLDLAVFDFQQHHSPEAPTGVKSNKPIAAPPLRKHSALNGTDAHAHARCTYLLYVVQAPVPVVVTHEYPVVLKERTKLSSFVRENKNTVCVVTNAETLVLKMC